MGHIRLGNLPDTAPWRRVVALLAEDADIAIVATATTDAAHKGLDLAHGDEGLVYTVLLLSRVVQAARQPDFGPALRRAGLPVNGALDLFAIVGSFSDAVDHHFFQKTCRTDIGEMAQLAAVESLTLLLNRRSEGLYETTPAEVKRAARQLSTKNGFANLTHDFFARFTRRFLGYHLGRELSNHVGGNGRFADPEDHNTYLDHLDVHCREAAYIVRDFAGGWYSKAQAEGGITRPKTRNFVNYALTKLQGELTRRGARHD